MTTLCDVDTLPGGWDDFFVGAVGAGAVLAGLLFVAISINVREILAEASLPSWAVVDDHVRGGATGCVAAGADARAIGAGDRARGTGRGGDRLCGHGGRGGALALAAHVRDAAARPPDLERRVRPAGGRRAARRRGDAGGRPRGHGLYAVAVGITVSFAVAVLNGWVLLVEIRR